MPAWCDRCKIAIDRARDQVRKANALLGYPYEEYDGVVFGVSDHTLCAINRLIETSSHLALEVGGLQERLTAAEEANARLASRLEALEGGG